MGYKVSQIGIGFDAVFFNFNVVLEKEDKAPNKVVKKCKNFADATNFAIEMAEELKVPVKSYTGKRMTHVQRRRLERLNRKRKR